MIRVWMTEQGHGTLEAKRNIQTEVEIGNTAVGEGAVVAEDLPNFMFALLLTCAFMVGEFQFEEMALAMLCTIGENMTDALSSKIYDYIMTFDATNGAVFPKTWEEMKHEFKNDNHGFSNN